MKRAISVRIVTLSVRAKPGSSRSELVCDNKDDGTYTAFVRSPPEAGKANGETSAAVSLRRPHNALQRSWPNSSRTILASSHRMWM